MYYDWADSERWEDVINQDYGRSSRMPLYVLTFLVTIAAIQPLVHYIMI
jgi:hypothetical protein